MDDEVVFGWRCRGWVLGFCKGEVCGGLGEKMGLFGFGSCDVFCVLLGKVWIGRVIEVDLLWMERV